MKLLRLTFPEKRIGEFVFLCESYEIKICLTYSKDGGFFDDNIFVVVKIETSAFPAEMKEEKLREKFSNCTILKF